MTNSETIEKAFYDEFGENPPAQLSAEFAQKVQAQVAYKGVGPIHGAFGRWKKKTGKGTTKVATKKAQAAGLDITQVKVKAVRGGVATSLEIIKRTRDTLWVKVND